ncbi:DUF2187 family protein [Mesobacillus thioparans]|uniref:DUF2187 family protein n=1 Tax=Mesobacillus thioparans TaxID=370439 RepID=UPI0039EE2E31
MQKNRAKIGDRISFQRKDLTIEGEVEIVRDNSVIVRISDHANEKLEYETTKTVVRHSKYVIINPTISA